MQNISYTEILRDTHKQISTNIAGEELTCQFASDPENTRSFYRVIGKSPEQNQHVLSACQDDVCIGGMMLSLFLQEAPRNEADSSLIRNCYSDYDFDSFTTAVISEIHLPQMVRESEFMHNLFRMILGKSVMLRCHDIFYAESEELAGVFKKFAEGVGLKVTSKSPFSGLEVMKICLHAEPQ